MPMFPFAFGMTLSKLPAILSIAFLHPFFTTSFPLKNYFTLPPIILFSKYLATLVGQIFVPTIPTNSNLAQFHVCFLAIVSNIEAIKCFHVPTNRLYISRDVIFNESNFPFHQSESLIIPTDSTPSNVSILGPHPLTLPHMLTRLNNNRLALAQSPPLKEWVLQYPLP